MPPNLITKQEILAFTVKANKTNEQEILIWLKNKKHTKHRYCCHVQPLSSGARVALSRIRAQSNTLPQKPEHAF